MQRVRLRRPPSLATWLPSPLNTVSRHLTACRPAHDFVRHASSGKKKSSSNAQARKGTVSANALFTRTSPTSHKEDPYRPPPSPNKFTVFPEFVNSIDDLNRQPSTPRPNRMALGFWESRYRSWLLTNRIDTALERLYRRETTAAELRRAQRAVTMLRRNPDAYLGDGPAVRVLREIAREESRPFSPKRYAELQRGAKDYKLKMLRTICLRVGVAASVLLGVSLLLRNTLYNLRDFLDLQRERLSSADRTTTALKDETS